MRRLEIEGLLQDCTQIRPLIRRWWEAVWRHLLLAAFGLCLWMFSSGKGLAQVPSIEVGSVSGSPGATVDLPVTFSPGVEAVSTLQFDLNWSGLGYVSVATGASAGAAGKGAQASALPSGVRVLVFGLNQNALGAGDIATVRVSIPSSASEGDLAVNIGQISAAGPAGNNVTASGTSGTVTVTERAGPSSDAIFISQVIEGPFYRTNLGINSLSGLQATVGVYLVDPAGFILAFKSVLVQPNGLTQINRVVENLLGGAGAETVEANLYLESDQPINAWASQIENGTTDPSMLVSKRSGFTRILIPSSANTGSFVSSLVVLNVGLGDALVSIAAYGVNGQVLGQTTTPLTIPANGFLSFDNILEALGVNGNFGPIEINSLNNVPLIANSRVTGASNAGGFFEGLDWSDASTLQIIPHVLDTLQVRTNIGINNVSDSTATVLVRLMGASGNQRGATTVSVAPKGMTQIDHIIPTLLGASGSTNSEGYIRLESDQPIFGWTSQIDNVTEDPGFAVSRGQGQTRVLVQSASSIGRFSSSLVVVNTGSQDSLVNIVSRNVNGEITGSLSGVVIPPGGFFSSSNILDQLGAAFSFGPVEIISTNGQPMLVTSRILSDSGTSGFFEGQPFP